MIDTATIAELRRSFAAALDHEDAVQARKQLVAAGWFDALAADHEAAVSIVFGLQGASGHDVGMLDDVLLARAGQLALADDTEIAVGYPVAVGGSHVVLPARHQARRLVWLHDHDGRDVELLEVDGQLDGARADGIDPAMGLLALARRPAGPASWLSRGGSEPAWVDGVAADSVALARQMAAGARVLVEMAVEYARARRQFGVVIGSFQGVKHRLADAAVSIAAADAAIAAAAIAGRPDDARIAKALAARAATVCGRNCLQVFGGIGWTSEHDFHRYFRRNLVLDQLLGDGRSLERAIGQELRDGSHEEPWGVEIDSRFRAELLP